MISPCLFLASQDALEVIVWVNPSLTLRTELTDLTLVSEDTPEEFTDATLAIYDTYGDDVRGGDGVEEDKVAVMVLRIPNEEFTDGTVVMVL